MIMFCFFPVLLLTSGKLVHLELEHASGQTGSIGQLSLSHLFGPFTDVSLIY